MRIAIVQSDIHREDKEYNLNKAKEQIHFAALQGAELVCFPEMSFTGFSMNIDKTAENDLYTQRKISEWCMQYKIAVSFGWVKAAGALAENHYTIIDKKGIVLSDYIKIHPFSYDNENHFFVSGNKLSLVSLGDFCISTFICYDLRFPEIFQVASQKADMLLIAANWPAARSMHWKTLLQARAIETQSVVVGINCVGIQERCVYCGDSSVFDSDGTLLYELHNIESMAVLDIKNTSAKTREVFNVKQDRRNNLYIDFLNSYQK